MEVLGHADFPLTIATYARVNEDEPAEYEKVEFEVSYAVQIDEEANDYNIRAVRDLEHTGNGYFDFCSSSMTE